jgi:RND family efflux transporter MFP subunit
MKKIIGYSILIIAVVGIAALTISRINSTNAASEVKKEVIAPVRVDKPLRQTVLNQLEFNGDVAPIQQASIFSKVTGTLDRVFVDMGSQVHQNQLIALVDTTELFQIAQQAQASLSNAKLIYDRTKKLTAKDLSSQQEVDNAESTYNSAKAAYEASRIRLNYAKITAPFSGYITKRFLDQGAVVSANTAIAGSNSTIYTLMDINTVKVLINIFDRDVPAIAKVKEAIVTVDALPGRTFKGKVARYSQAINLATRTMPVEIQIPNSDHALKPGAFARVTLILGEHPDALTLPTEAVLKDQSGAYVYTVDNGVAHKLPVSIGTENGGRTEILKGLDGSEDIVISGQNFVKDKGKVLISK